MKIDFSKVLLAISGQPLKKNEDGGEATMQHVCREALLVDHKAEGPVSGEEKFERWQLASKLNGEVDLKAEEIAKIKKLLGYLYPAVVVGPAYEILEAKV